MRREATSCSFSPIAHEIWHRCLPWGAHVQDTFFDSGMQVVLPLYLSISLATTRWGTRLHCVHANYFIQSVTNSHEEFGVRCLPFTIKMCTTHFLTVVELV